MGIDLLIFSLDVSIFALAFWKLHTSEVDERPFIFYLLFCIAYGFATMGDVDRLVPAIYFGPLSEYSSGARSLIVKTLIALAFFYAVAMGESRKTKSIRKTIAANNLSTQLDALNCPGGVKPFLKGLLNLIR